MTTIVPLVPNWASPIKETYEFKTDVLTARDGTEQRRSLRQSARLTISYEAVADDDRRTAIERTQARIGEIVVLPNYLRAVRTTAAMPAGANTITISINPSWLAEGSTVALRYRRRVQLFDIESVQNGFVTFAAPADAAWSAGTAIHPVYQGYLSPSQVTLLSADVGTTSVEFKVDPGSTTFDEGSVGDTLGYIEILTVRPNWANSPNESYSRTVDTVDYGFGRSTLFAPVEYAPRTFQATYYDQGADDGEILRRFFLRQAGQRRYFYVPSWTNDFEIVETGLGEFVVDGRDAYDAYELNTVHRAVWLRFADGTAQAYAISDMVLVEDNTRILLADTSADFPAAITSGSWLYLSRFATDAMTFSWILDTTFSAMLAVKVMPGAAAEDMFDDGLDGASRYMIRTYGWDFTLNVLYTPIEESMHKWVDISAGVPRKA